MILQIHGEWASYIEDQVRGGAFPDADAVILDALARQRQAQPTPPVSPADDNPLLGLFSDAPELIDEIVAQAMHNRRHQPWRLADDE